MIKKPNILMIMCDQLRSDSLGCYGSNEVDTPNIDELSKIGVTFDNHFCSTPVCMPSRASVMTGRYPSANGTKDNGIPLRESEITYPEVLRNEGYVTSAIGKMHLTSMLEKKYNEHDDWPKGNYGFDIIHTTTDNKDGEYLNWLKNTNYDSYLIVKEQGENKIKEDLASPSEKQQEGAPQVNPSNINPEFHQSSWISNKTIQVIDETLEKEESFFIMTSFVDPHHPFDPPINLYEKYLNRQLTLPMKKQDELLDKPAHFRMHERSHGYSNEKYDYRKLTDQEWLSVKAAYLGMIDLIDTSIGKILIHLKEKEILEDTLIIFTSDHGELLGDHGILFKGPFHYDSIIKVPLIVTFPKILPQGTRINNITEHVDLMPTILEYAKARIPFGVQGQSLGGLLRGDKNGKNNALVEFDANDWGLNLRTLITKNYKITYYANETFGELYNRLEDPEEIENLWDKEEYHDIKQILLKELFDRIINAVDPLPIRVGKY